MARGLAALLWPARPRTAASTRYRTDGVTSSLAHSRGPPPAPRERDVRAPGPLVIVTGAPRPGDGPV